MFYQMDQSSLSRKTSCACLGLAKRLAPACFMLLVALDALCQEFPNRAVRIVTTASGGSADFTARLIAQTIAGPLGQPVIVDNRAAVQAIEAVSRATADGYTLLMASNSLWTAPLFKEAGYDPIKDFAAISLANRLPLLLVVNPSLPAKSVKELIALAKARPGEMNYASQASGGGSHLAMELFNAMAGVNIVRISYKGGAALIADLISGEVQVTMKDTSQINPHLKSGRLRALAVTSAKSSALAPGIPTLAASGLPGYEAVTMTGLFAPGRTSITVINRLNKEFVRALAQPDVNRRFMEAGVEAASSTPEQFDAAIKADMVQMGNVIRQAKIKLE